MKQELYKDKALLQLFSRDEKIPFPDTLEKQIMQKVYKAQKRKEILNLCIVGAVSVGMSVGGFAMLKYYLKFDFSILFREFTEKPDNLLLPDFSPILFISLIVCCLLWIDHRIRMKWLRTD